MEKLGTGTTMTATTTTGRSRLGARTRRRGVSDVGGVDGDCEITMKETITGDQEMTQEKDTIVVWCLTTSWNHSWRTSLLM